MTDTTITCPKCGAEIPLTEAVAHRVREDLSADFEKQRAALNAALAEREHRLAEEQSVLEKRAQSLQAEVARQLDAERQNLQAVAARQAEEKLGLQLRDAQNQLAEQGGRLKEALDNELVLRKQQRELENAKANLELEMTRRLDAERQKIADTARQQASEAERLKLADKDGIIKGLQEQIALLQQRAEQGSMQLQGETLEIALETDLRAAFLSDEIVEVRKGERGADVAQRVRTQNGFDCGAILWEAKRAKNWSAQWPAKLKEDQREAKTELAVLVTTSPLPSIRGIGQVEGVWVCEPIFAVALGAALRQGLVNTAAQRLQETNRTDKMARLYDYLCGVEFKQHIEAVVEAFKDLQTQLSAEQRAFAKQWKEREQQLHKAITHTAMLYGGIQGIAGREALPEIAPLQLPPATDET
jgi:hypothetical protein